MTEIGSIEAYMDFRIISGRKLAVKCVFEEDGTLVRWMIRDISLSSS